MEGLLDGLGTDCWGMMTSVIGLYSGSRLVVGRKGWGDGHLTRLGWRWTVVRRGGDAAGIGCAQDLEGVVMR